MTATLTDTAGNASPDSTTTLVTVDTVAPAVAITTIEGGDDPINAAEAAGGIDVSGTAEIGSTLTVNGVAVTVDASGGWTISVAPPAVDGPLTVAAVATDAAGNTATATHELTVDTLPPAVAITTIEGGDDLIDAAEAAGGITVSGTAEIGATLTVNGAPVTVDASGNWTTSVVPAGNGPLTVTAVATDAAGNSATATHALTVTGSDILVVDTTTGQDLGATGAPYNGPVPGLQHQYLYPGTNPENTIVSSDNWFIVGGPGDDALQAFGGYNVLDGSGGSNFLTGGSGTDTFFVDNGNPSADVWSTINGLHAGDDVTIFGVDPTANIEFADNQGAVDFSGLTLHIVSSDQPTQSLTLTGYSTSDLGNGHLSIQFGSEPGGMPYMHIISS